MTKIHKNKNEYALLLVKIFRDAALGLDLLHSHGLWHGNISAKSILINLDTSQV